MSEGLGAENPRVRPDETEAWPHDRYLPESVEDPRAISARPLFPVDRRATVHLPLAVLVAILPGLYALLHWDLTPPGPWWGLRGLAVLDGRWVDQVPLTGLGPVSEARSYRLVAMQPPLYAWLEAGALWASGTRLPLATVIPGYVAGAALVMLVYALGAAWGRPSLGLVAAILTAFNDTLLAHMQHATPATLSAATSAATLLCYSRSMRGQPMQRFLWNAATAVGLAAALLTAGPLALALPIILVLHRLLTGTEPIPRRHQRNWSVIRPILAERTKTWVAGLVLTGLAGALAAPWFVAMTRLYGKVFWHALLAPPRAGARIESLDPLAHLLLLSPQTLAIGVYGAWRAARRLALAGRGSDNAQVSGGALWLAWLVAAVVLMLIWRDGPSPSLQLLVLVPLNVLASQTIVDLVGRRLPTRSLLWLAPATVLALSWANVPELRAAGSAIAGWSWQAFAKLRALPTVAAGLLSVALAVRVAGVWARGGDGRRRILIGAFLLFVLGVDVATGLHEVAFRHRETADLLALRDAVVRRQARRPLSLLAVVSSDGDPTQEGQPKDGKPMAQPGGRLRFILRTALPHLAQIDVAHVDDLRRLPDAERLVVLAGTGVRLSYALQSRLRLEVVYPGPSGLLAVYGTPVDPPPPRGQAQRPSHIVRAPFAEGRQRLK